ncbi:MAG: helix-turn-helix domain-containing protein [Acidobacteriota bacterium]
MSYIEIEPSVKVAAVKRYWETNNLKRTAKEFRVSRTALYDWVRLAEANLEKIFLHSKPGKRTATPEEENEKLQAQLRDVLDAYHNKSQSAPSLLPEALARCPHCGSSCVRNGRVRTKLHGLRQRLWCRQCLRSVYVEVKKTL